MPRKYSHMIRAVAAAGMALTLLYALTSLINVSAPPVASAQSGASLFVRKIPLAGNDIVFSPSTNKLYVSVPSRAGGAGNSVASIDPSTGAVDRHVFVGSEPGKLALADDGRTLYVGLDGAGAVRRYDLATQTAGAQFTLGESLFNGPFFVKDMAVAPGNPDLVAVSRRNLTSSPDFEGVAVYDGGVQRPQTSQRHTGSDNIAFGALPTTLYGFTADGGGGLEKLNVTPSGLTVAKSTRLAARGGDFKYAGGLLYMPSGEVYDAETATLFGTYSLPFVPFSLVEPDLSAGRVYFLTGQSAFGDFEIRTLTLRAFDRQTFVPLGTVEIPNVAGQVRSLVRWGANGLAFASSGGQVYVIQTSLVPSGEPVPTPTPTPVATPTPSPTPTPTPAPGELREVPLAAKDIVFNAATQTAYATLPSSAGGAGNSVAPFDPFSGAVGQSVFVGSEPNKMALSDNGQYIYVGLDGAKAVLRFDLTSNTPDLQFSLGSDVFGRQLSAVDLAVPPGRPRSVAVVRGGGGTSGGGVAVYDDGVQRPNAITSFHTINVIEYSASPLILYGHNSFTSEGGFRKVATPACGPTVLSTKGSLLWGTDFKIENGLAYSTSGRVVDPEAGTIVGSFPVRAGLDTGFFASAVLVDSAAGRAYFFLPADSFDTSPKTMLVRAFDLRTFLHVGTLAVPNISGMPTAVFRWGADGFAFRTSGNKVYLLRTSLVPNATEAVTPAPAPTPPTYTIRGQVGSFGGPPLPPVTVSLTGGGAGATTTTTGPDGSFSFAGLPLCTDFTVTPQPLEHYTFSPASVTLTAANQNNPNQSTAFFSAQAKAITLTQSTTSVSEAAGSLTVNITRSGNLSEPATVFYQTGDNTASARSDYNAAIGTLNFGPNESAKQVKVFVTNDVWAEQAETFTLSLSSPSGALLGPTSTLTVTINDDDAANGTNNPADDPQFFVRQHYRDFFSRDADAPGLAHWTGVIDSCGADAQCREVNRINVSGAFFLSIEFQQTGFLVEKAYKAAFGDATGTSTLNGAHTLNVPIIRFEEFLPDTQRIGRDVVVLQDGWEAKLEANKAAFFQEFVQRQRFLNDYPLGMAPTDFVDRLNGRAGGPLDSSERHALINELTNNNTTAGRASVLWKVAEDPTLDAAEKNRAFVLMQYFGYLRRNPNDAPDSDYTGYDFWLGNLNAFDGNFVRAELVKAFIRSTEYRQRFGQ